MKFKDLIKTYSFWSTLAGAIVVLVQVLGRIFNFIAPNDLVHDLIIAIAGVLVALGIVTMPKAENKELSSEDKEENSASQEPTTDEKNSSAEDSEKEDCEPGNNKQEKPGDKEEQ